jgi:hypothetical protein
MRPDPSSRCEHCRYFVPMRVAAKVGVALTRSALQGSCADLAKRMYAPTGEALAAPRVWSDWSCWGFTPNASVVEKAMPKSGSWLENVAPGMPSNVVEFGARRSKRPLNAASKDDAL